VLQDLLKSVSNVSLARRHWQDMCRDMLRLKDEATVLKIAAETLHRYAQFDAPERQAFFRFLLEEFRVDRDSLKAAIAQYQLDPSPSAVQRLNHASQPARRQIFEILNMVPHGTLQLVAMRSDLLELLGEDRDLEPVDQDLVALFRAWFNRGFLSLEQIDWQTPAAVLEKLIEYEAVHEIKGWEDLHRRLSADRRCYAFFHPALPGEPIIFVQAALTDGLAGSIDQIIRAETSEPEARADTAIFYSISNCQTGLKGIAFGDMLIKQVVDLISGELPHIKTFATLSPVPGFNRWLSTMRESDSLSEVERRVVDRVLADADDFAWQDDDADAVLSALCAHYLLKEKRGDAPLDAVARFHLRNGARLERMNWAGDTSPKGLCESAGLLVNYVYDKKSVTRNHERYVYDGDVVSSSAIASLARKRR
jgi:malonyl-CoA decarboxylase